MATLASVRRSVSDRAVAFIEAFITSSDLRASDFLPSERELMERLAVGRSAVREALITLHRRGLVQIRNGEKARVASPTPAMAIEELSGAAHRMLAQPNGVQHFQDARLLLESGVAARAAERAREEDLGTLARILQANRRAIGDQAAFEQTDIDFHLAIARAAGNPIFVAMLEGIVTWLLEQRNVSGRSRGAGKAAFEAHRRIYDAIAAGDPKASADAMRQHLDAVHKRYWAARKHAVRDTA